MEENFGLEKQPHTKISENSKEYKNFYREMEKNSFTVQPFFGAKELQTIKVARKIKPNELKAVFKTNSQSEAIAGILAKPRAKLKELYQNPERRQQVESFFKNSINFVADTSEGDTDRLKMFSVEDLFTLDKVTDDLFEKMLNHHVDVLTKSKANFDNSLPLCKLNFDSLTMKLFRKGLLPGVYLDQARRLQKVKVNLVDPLMVRLTETWGLADLDDLEVDISGFVPKKDLQVVFDHEMLHVISGSTLLATLDTEKKRKVYKKIFNIESQKSGLHYHAGKERFRWLNEAMTEELRSIGSTSKNKLCFYGKERDLLSSLIDSSNGNITLKMLADAYFENYDLSAPIGERIPAWNRFYEAVNTTYGKGFLLRLDNLVADKGTEQATQIFRNDGKEI